MVWFAFGDFQSDYYDCHVAEMDRKKCLDSVFKKYTVSKARACSLKDNLYNYPVQASRPNKKVTVQQFYKYNNKLYYPIVVGKQLWQLCEDVENYVYSYDCKTKKIIDLGIKSSLCGVKMSYGSKNNILFENIPYEWWDPMVYRMFDAKNMTIDTLNFVKFNGFKSYKEYIKLQLQSLFETTKSKYISAWYPTKISWWLFADYWIGIDKYFPNNWYDWYLSLKDIKSDFTATLEYGIALDDNYFPLQGARVDLLKKEITLSK